MPRYSPDLLSRIKRGDTVFTIFEELVLKKKGQHAHDAIDATVEYPDIPVVASTTNGYQSIGISVPEDRVAGPPIAHNTPTNGNGVSPNLVPRIEVAQPEYDEEEGWSFPEIRTGIDAPVPESYVRTGSREVRGTDSL
ncbi:hypothetical protein NMY22_g10904 [Coprinellus aureogranulatus]|nr:hypothetical protein NMY22_g10904 [Coprinellus aureogranulatus]